MKKPPVDPCDLAILVRRNEASPAEQRRLQLQLGASDVERELYTLGVEYDAMDAEQPGDAALLKRLLGNVLPEKPAHRRTARWLPFAAVVLVSGIASAAFVLSPPRLFHSAVIEPCSSDSAGARSASSCLGAQPVSELSTPGKFAVSSEPAHAFSEERALSAERRELSLPTAEPLRVKGPALTGAPTESAVELFSRANSERKAGRTAAASDLYQRLQKRFPSSRESAVSQVMLARMLAQKGKHAQAAQYFERYLAGTDRSLAEEALLGLGQSLRAVGRSKEASRVFGSLIERFPHSVYATSAKQSLRELD